MIAAERKSELHAQAREAVREALRSSRNAFPLSREEAGRDGVLAREAQRWSAVNDLLTCRDQLSRAMADAKRQFAGVERYVRGEAGAFDPQGALRARGPEIDRLCGEFALRVEMAIDAEYELLYACEVANVLPGYVQCALGELGEALMKDTPAAHVHVELAAAKLRAMDEDAQTTPARGH